MKEFVAFYENIFTKEECDTLIDLVETGDGIVIGDDNGTKFYQVNVDDVKIMNRLVGVGKTYMENWPNRFPDNYSIEQPRVKRYDPGDQFNWHVDVKDSSTCGRFISFLVYLNSNYKNGKTIFDAFKITPKDGGVLVFPPMWMYYHKGDVVKTNSKYIMSSYLRYV